MLPRKCRLFITLQYKVCACHLLPKHFWWILHVVVTVINASAAVTLLEQRPEKNQALSGIRTHDLCDASAVLSQLSYQSHMRAVVCGLGQINLTTCSSVIYLLRKRYLLSVRSASIFKTISAYFYFASFWLGQVVVLYFCFRGYFTMERVCTCEVTD